MHIKSPNHDGALVGGGDGSGQTSNKGCGRRDNCNRWARTMERTAKESQCQWSTISQQNVHGQLQMRWIREWQYKLLDEQLWTSLDTRWATMVEDREPQSSATSWQKKMLADNAGWSVDGDRCWRATVGMFGKWQMSSNNKAAELLLSVVAAAATIALLQATTSSFGPCIDCSEAAVAAQVAYHP